MNLDEFGVYRRMLAWRRGGEGLVETGSYKGSCPACRSCLRWFRVSMVLFLLRYLPYDPTLTRRVLNPLGRAKAGKSCALWRSCGSRLKPDAEQRNRVIPLVAGARRQCFPYPWRLTSPLVDVVVSKVRKHYLKGSIISNIIWKGPNIVYLESSGESFPNMQDFLNTSISVKRNDKSVCLSRTFLGFPRH